MASRTIPPSVSTSSQQAHELDEAIRVNQQERRSHLKLGVPEHGWTMFSGISQPHSRGRVSLSGPNPHDPLHIVRNGLSEPADVEAALASVALAREIGNAPALASLNRREVMPGNLRGPELLDFLRNAAVTYWQETCTAKMGRDAMSVVDSELRVYGIQSADRGWFCVSPYSKSQTPWLRASWLASARLSCCRRPMVLKWPQDRSFSRACSRQHKRNAAAPPLANG